jgi:hypothetical protein
LNYPENSLSSLSEIPTVLQKSQFCENRSPRFFERKDRAKWWFFEKHAAFMDALPYRWGAICVSSYFTSTYDAVFWRFLLEIDVDFPPLLTDTCEADFSTEDRFSACPGLFCQVRNLSYMI